MTKNEIRAALSDLNVEAPKKANLATLETMLAEATAPAGSTASKPLPVSTKPTQVAVGLKIEKNRPEQNGIKRPSAGGRCRAVWDALDEYRENEGEIPDAQFVKMLAEENGWNPNNASIEFYQWRKFNGITGRQKKAAAPAEAE